MVAGFKSQVAETVACDIYPREAKASASSRLRIFTSAMP
jgi:hypothetical protein